MEPRGVFKDLVGVLGAHIDFDRRVGFRIGADDRRDPRIAVFPVPHACDEILSGGFRGGVGSIARDFLAAVSVGFPHF